MEALKLDVKKTALVVIDLQIGVVNMDMKAAPFENKQVVENSVKLAETFREKGGFVTLVHVDFLDGEDALKPVTDLEMPSVEKPKDFSKIISELGPKTGDHVVTKRQWGAFFGTDLDLQLRRRGIDTIILCGIATNIGVETTAREAFQRNYQQIFAIDAMNGLTKEEHEHTEKFLFPKMGRVRMTEEIINAL